MDTDLRNGLWDIFWSGFICRLEAQYDESISRPYIGAIRLLWHEFFKQPIDRIPFQSAQSIKESIREWFYKAQWHEVYDLIEFVAQRIRPLDDRNFRKSCNYILERELSGYRFIGEHIAPITDKIEMKEINQSLETTVDRMFKGVRTHLESALDKLSDKKNPDYRNSIKESISAVESVCVVITGNKKATLGDALKVIRDTAGLHPALEKGFSAIYGYTSDADGIRHAMIEESQCNFDDAKYMLVSCSAFVNYLIAKANKAGLIK
jgi:hypothetical protein